MKAFLIIPMGGKGKRFVNAGFKTYKSFLKAEGGNSIFENIISNFKGFNLEIIILANSKKLKKYNKFVKKKNIHIVNIEDHNKGPLFSIFQGLEKIKKIVKNNENIFFSYTDINWKWNINKIKKIIKTKKIIVFTHTGFHPHLETNPKSDFCLIKNNQVKYIKQKKTFTNNYKKEFLASGCYYLKNVNLLENFFLNFKKNFSNKKEYYFVSLINYFIDKNIIVNNFQINKFVHLGTPTQYLDFLKWKDTINSNRKINLNKNLTIMLAGGKGKRVGSLNKEKPFLNFLNKPIYKYIFDKYSSKKKIIITNKKFNKYFKVRKYKIHLIPKTNSMFDSILFSEKLLKYNDNYILTSCDCFGDFNLRLMQMKKNKYDMIFFAFKFSEIQKKLYNAHTQLITTSKNITNIRVKKPFKSNYLGHAGFFWINSGKVFNFLKEYKNSQNYKKLEREILIDDYFSYLVKYKKVNASYIVLDNYVHLGSTIEYLEYNYWKDYFN